MDQRKYRRIYKRVTKTTLEVNYTDYVIKDYLKYLADQNLIRYDGRSKKNEALVDVTSLKSERSKLEYVIQNLTQWVKMLEKYEYERSYRYSYLYRISNESINKIKGALDKGKFIVFTDNNKINDELYTLMANPTYRELDDKIYLKFNLKLESKLKSNSIIKHTVLVVIHKELEALEIRQDTVPMQYNPREKFYQSNALAVKAYLLSLGVTDVKNADLQAIIKYMKKNKKDEVKITALDMARGGARASLDSASDEKMELPILDEIKHILSEEIFNDTDDKVVAIKERFESFIYEVEELSTLPAAKSYWVDTGYLISMCDGELEGEQPFVRWLGGLKGRESMDYVAKYIIQCENELEAELCD